MPNEFLEVTNAGQARNQNLILQLLQMRQQQQQFGQAQEFRERDLQAEIDRNTEAARRNKEAEERAKRTETRLQNAQDFRQKMDESLFSFNIQKLSKADQIREVKDGEEPVLTDPVSKKGFRLTTPLEESASKRKKRQEALTSEFEDLNNFLIQNGEAPLDADTFAKVRLSPALVRQQTLRGMTESAAMAAAKKQTDDPLQQAIIANKFVNSLRPKDPKGTTGLSGVSGLRAAGQALVSEMFTDAEAELSKTQKDPPIDSIAKFIEGDFENFIERTLDKQGIKDPAQRFTLQGEMFRILGGMISKEKQLTFGQMMMNQMLGGGDGEINFGRNPSITGEDNPF